MLIDNLDWYRVFYHTAKLGSLSKAAEELYITQPAVTHTIKQLEAKLGGPLFFRTSKGVTLTSEGQVLYSYIEQAYHMIGTGEKKIAELQQLLSGEITIGAGDTLCRHYLLPYLEQFRQQYPDVKIRVTNRTSPETLALLKNGRIDLGIVNLPIKDQRIHIRESLPLQDCFVVDAKYKELAERPLTWEALLEVPLILLEEGSSSRAYIDGLLHSHGVKVKPEIELGSLDLLVQFAQAGFGAAYVIRSLVERELHEGSLLELKLTPPIPPRHIGIATLQGVPLSAAASRLLQLLP
jgi:LysR family transcriptional regulator, cyn operon transcriptional activator